MIWVYTIFLKINNNLIFQFLTMIFESEQPYFSRKTDFSNFIFGYILFDVHKMVILKWPNYKV